MLTGSQKEVTQCSVRILVYLTSVYHNFWIEQRAGGAILGPSGKQTTTYPPMLCRQAGYRTQMRVERTREVA